MEAWGWVVGWAAVSGQEVVSMTNLQIIADNDKPTSTSNVAVGGSTADGAPRWLR